MGAPVVIIKETDLTTRIPEFPGIYLYIQIPEAPRGPVGEPTLCSSESQFLKRYTPAERIEVGYDMSFFSVNAAFGGSNKIWINRIAKNALYGGLAVVETGTVGGNTPLTAGVENPEAYAFGVTELFILIGKNEGDYNNDISVKITDHSAKEPGAFLISVYFRGEWKEDHVCTRTEGHRDGFGNSTYIEDRLRASSYIDAIDNLMFEPDVLPEWQETPLAFESGDDGDAVTDGDMILGLDKARNRHSLPVTLLLDGGWATNAYHLALVDCAEFRKDCVAILSTPYYVEDNADTYLTDIVAYRTDTLNVNTSYAAMYTPHVTIYDKYNDREIWISPDGYAAAMIAKTGANYELWYPTGGNRRGVINVMEVRHRFTDDELDFLYDNGINPIRYRAGKGIAFWGQKTLLYRPSNLDRLNVRLLLVTIEPQIADALEDFIMEFNDEPTRAAVTLMIVDRMERVKARRGVTDFKVMCDENNNLADDIQNHIMNVWLFIKPNKSVEYIPFNTIITKESMSFSLAASLV